MKKIIYFLLITAAWLYCEKITVAVAANVQYAFEDIRAEFTKETGIEVVPIIGSSGKLTAQITNGAPFDIFLSADTKYPQAIYDAKLASEQPFIYAGGALVMWSMNLKEVNCSAEYISGDRIKKIAIANPDTAPYGRATVEFLKNIGVYDKVSSKLVYGESISQANQYVLSSAVDFGFTSKSTVIASDMKDKGKWVEVNDSTYTAIDQAVVLLKYGTDNHPDSSKKFYKFLKSKKAVNILKNYGYIVK
jgi:molybdate transport system substrate-binding protein